MARPEKSQSERDKRKVGFDLKVQHRHPKTGRVIKHTPYTLKISKDRGQIFVRNGVEFFPDGTRCDKKPVKEAKE